MSMEENKAIIKRFVGKWAIKDPSTIDEFIAPDCKFPPWPDGIEGVRQFYLSEFEAYSDRQYTIENPDTDVLADGDQVAIKLLYHATRVTGEKEVEVGINIYRLRDGKITYGWGVWQDKE